MQDRATDRLFVEVMGKYLWMAVTADEYETPLVIADTAQELADKFGITASSIITYISRNHGGRQNGYKYVKVPNTD